jgi:hypothetical protein
VTPGAIVETAAGADSRGTLSLGALLALIGIDAGPGQPTGDIEVKNLAGDAQKEPPKNQVPLLQGDDLSDEWSSITATFSDLVAKNVPYDPLGPNSNSLIGETLDTLGIGLPESVEGLLAPGFNQNVVALSPGMPRRCGRFGRLAASLASSASPTQ